MFKKSVQQQLLSYHYNGPRKQTKSNKLNLFGKAIVIIDKIKEVESLANIRQLDLSHNGISEIQNIEQFANVQFINLSHNRIIEQQEILKLQKLNRLNTLYIKGNPFLREKNSHKVIAFLLAVSTDVEIVSNDTAQLIEAFSNKTIQNLCFSHYLRKIENHIELANNYQLVETFINPDYAIFPKIKKMFEENLKDLSIKRQLIESVDTRCFEDEGIMCEYFKKRVEEAENQRSQIIKRIYEREQLLRNVRSTYNQRVVPKRIVPRSMNGTIVTGYFSPPKLKESRKQHKTQNLVTATRPRNKHEDIQNSPPHRVSESSEWRENANEQSLMNSLIKMNPLYHLLHSPLPSLKSHQKELLIQNLSLHLKEKMKELQKYEKKDQQCIRARQEMNDLQEHFREMSAQFKNQQDRANQKLRKLSSICQQESQRVENLCDRIKNYQQELEALKQENDRIKIQNAQLKQKLALYQSQEDLEDAIKTHFSKNLKKKYLQTLIKKAYHMKQLTLYHQLNLKIQQKQIKQEYFQQMIFFTSLSKHERKIEVAQRQKYYHSFVNLLKTAKMTRKLQENVCEALRMKNKQHFINRLNINHQKMSVFHSKCSKMKSKNEKMLKMKIFNLLKEQLQDKYEQMEKQRFQKESSLLTVRKTFKLWKRFICEEENRLALCEKEVVNGIKRYYLHIFMHNSKSQLTFRASAQATQDFLAKMRKIKAYFNFSKTTSTVILQRKLKSRKVQLIRQHQYLFWFFSTIRDCKVKKRILVEKQLHMRKLNEEQRMKQKMEDKKVKLNKRILFGQRLSELGKKTIIKILIREKQSINLLQDRQNRLFKTFITNLRSNWLSKYKLSVKLQILRKSPSITNKIKQFFRCFSISQRKARLFEQRSNRDRLLKCLYRWKFYNSWSKMQSYKQMYQQLEPEISHVSQLQRQVAKEKQLLMIEIQQKDLIVRDCQKKFEEYEYILHSKDLKYQKLKDIYAELVNQQEMNATIKLNKDKTPEDDIYLKYLPNQIRNNTPAKYSFQTKMPEQNNYLKGRTFANPDYLKPESANQSDKRGSYLKNKDTFLSSFKRF